MTIDRSQLASDQILWLPAANVLTAAHMSSISETIITAVGDDSSNQVEVLCKSLRTIAEVNRAKWRVDSQGVKREKLEELEIERFEKTSRDPWGDFIRTLPEIYLAIGYTGTEILKPIGIKINNGTAITVDTCTEYSDDSSQLYL